MTEQTSRHSEHYRNIPIVDLLESGSRDSVRVFGWQGRELRVRGGLVAVALLAAVLVVLFNNLNQRHVDDAADAIRRSAALDSQVIEALEVLDEIAELEAIGDVSGRDLDFLLSDPGAVVAAIRSAFDLAVPGVIVTKVEMLDSATVAVELRVISNAAAIEWRSDIADAEGVARVQGFDVVEGASSLTYRATLVAGGAS